MWHTYIACYHVLGCCAAIRPDLKLEVKFLHHHPYYISPFCHGTQPDVSTRQALAYLH